METPKDIYAKSSDATVKNTALNAQINNDDWLTFMKAFEQTDLYKNNSKCHLYPIFVRWLKGNYYVPVKKH